MFEPRTKQPTDADLIEILAIKGMGWRIHNTSGHRPDTRDIPHAWRWNLERPRLMVYLGGDGHKANVEFNPLADEACAIELLNRLATKGIALDGWDLATEAGRRAFCEAARERLNAEPEPAPELPAEVIGSPAVTVDGIAAGVESIFSAAAKTETLPEPTHE